MSYATLADGSPIPSHLTQSPNTPFTVGKIQILDDIVFGYSGMINWDVTAAATYRMMAFTLERSALLQADFNWKGTVAGNADLGFMITIDDEEVMNWSSNSSGTKVDSQQPYQFLLPANRNCLIDVTNPNAQAQLGIDFNVGFVGKLL